eukprot:CAMPEP_0170402802 /NCGR_PEP_ID=MMETSP0117_2-20130122/25755_1 /TAXON_ID=400756 /ORGANISM="Durinskia baltica, Strain CSIRO CS-38" /LENGTH=141 /DNA_ID=CAMNT_0010659701 /DNA_START=14 /DNA_END=436 /DNA_ORIENTATION=+
MTVGGKAEAAEAREAATALGAGPVAAAGGRDICDAVELLSPRAHSRPWRRGDVKAMVAAGPLASAREACGAAACGALTSSACTRSIPGLREPLALLRTFSDRLDCVRCFSPCVHSLTASCKRAACAAWAIGAGHQSRQQGD